MPSSPSSLSSLTVPEVERLLPTDALRPEAPPPPTPEAPRFDGGPGRLLAGRYRLEREIGEGGMGVVYRAWDLLSGEDVAVKILPARTATQRRQARRERTALRWLRLPGVVRLRDDGEEEGWSFLVMDLVEGEPFPGGTWARLAGPARGLLEILARVHALGVIHRDLKPGNVLVSPAGRVVLLDLGLATGRAVAPGLERVHAAGTLRYMAPEQRRGERVDAAADLYAVGVLLEEALAGGEEEAPAPVRQMIGRLLAEAPEDRPASALEVLRALAPDAPRAGTTTAPLLGSGPLSLAALAALFSGFEALFHGPSAAAATLWARTAGRRALVEAELAAWIRAGLAFQVEEGLAIRDPDLERLRIGLALDPAHGEDPGGDPGRLLRLLERAGSGLKDGVAGGILRWSARRTQAAATALLDRGVAWRGADGRLLARPILRAPSDEGRADHRALSRQEQDAPEARLWHLLAAGGPVRGLLAELRAAVDLLLESGRLSQAEALAGEGLRLAWEVEDGAAEQALLERLVLAALRQDSREAQDRARYALGRAPVQDSAQGRLDMLLQAKRAAADGERTRARALLGDLPEFEHAELEIWRMDVAVLCARAEGVEAEADLLDALRPWAAAERGRAARRASWLGNLRYRQGRYADAAELHLAACASRSGQDARLGARVHAAMAWLEALELDEAVAGAEAAAREAAGLRLPFVEALATFVTRVADLRRGRLSAPDVALVDAAHLLGPTYEMPLCAAEAAHAWRLGLLPVAARLGARAAAGFAALGLRGQALVMEALAAASGPAPSRAALDALAARAHATSEADFAVQALGLLCRAVAEPPPAWAAEARARAEARPRDQWSLVLDVLSFAESVDPPRSAPGSTPASSSQR